MLVETQQLSDIRLANYDKSIGLRFGVYDLLHSGHQDGLNLTKSLADIVVIGVMPDSYATRTKGPSRPINSEIKRAQSIDQANEVDYTFMVPENHLAIVGVFLKLNPDVYVEDFEHHTEYELFKRAFLKVMKIDYMVDEHPKPVSTTSMLATLGLEEAIIKSGLNYHSS